MSSNNNLETSLKVMCVWMWHKRTVDDSFFSNRVLSCLMENLHTDSITPECEEQLLHLEFFIARDFR